MCLLGNFEFYSFIWEKINSSRVDDKYMLLKRREAEWISITWEALLIWCYKFSFTDSKIIISCTFNSKKRSKSLFFKRISKYLVSVLYTIIHKEPDRYYASFFHLIPRNENFVWCLMFHTKSSNVSLKICFFSNL